MKTDSGMPSKALQEVWAWKAAVWEDLKDIPFADGARIVAKRSDDAARALGFRVARSTSRALHAAEDGPAYGA